MPRLQQLTPLSKAQTNGSPRRPLRMAIGIATVGRSSILHETLRRILHQSRPADQIIICTPHAEDRLPSDIKSSIATVVSAHPGLPFQRNAILSFAKDFDAVLFLDDDFIPSTDYLANLERVLCDHPDLVIVTGKVLKDGVCGPGLSFSDADAIISAEGAGISMGDS